MKAYFITLIMVSATSVVASSISAEGKTKKYIDLLLGFIILLALLSPLKELEVLIPPLPDISSPEEEVSPADPVWEATEVALRSAICEAFSLSEGWVLVDVSGTLTDTGASIQRVTVTLSEQAKRHKEAVEQYLSLQIKTDCEVRVYVG